MRRLLLVLAVFLAGIQLHAQVDSVRLAVLEGMLDEYFAALRPEPVEVKTRECDYIIETCTDSLLRQKVAVRLYGMYMDSKLMGDESVVVHIFDRWFADGTVKMLSDVDFLNASIYARFNRQTLLGCQAPQLTLETRDGGFDTLPAEGRCSILFFYDVQCPKCLMESILLGHLLAEGGHSVDFYAVYVGDDREAWDKYIADRFSVEMPGVTIHHLWDPSLDSGFQEAYGLLQTPRLLLTSPQGEIIGRGLDVEALRRLLPYADMLQDLHDRCPVGERLPSVNVPGTLYRGRCVKEKAFDLAKFRGRPGYVVFHTDGCANCDAALANIPLLTASGARVFTVDVDAIFAEDEEKAARLFDLFDLTVFPLVIEVDRRGKVVSRSHSF